MAISVHVCAWRWAHAYMHTRVAGQGEEALIRGQGAGVTKQWQGEARPAGATPVWSSSERRTYPPSMEARAHQLGFPRKFN